MAKTTKAHYNLFKKECEYWKKRFQLNDWEIMYYHNQALKGI